MNDVLESLLSQSDSVSLCWLGNDGWLISYAGNLIGIDLDLLNPLRTSPSPLKPEDIAQHLRYLLVSHDHDDHFSVATCGRLAAQGDTRFVLPESCRERFTQSDLPPDRATWVVPRKTYEIDDFLSVTTTRALHGHFHQSVYEHANMFDCGYRFALGDTVFYQPGDSVLLSEHLEMTGIDVLFVSPTEHNMMIENSVRLITAIDPAHIFAQHFDTYEYKREYEHWVVGHPQEVMDLLPSDLQKRMTIPIQGEIYRM